MFYYDFDLLYFELIKWTWIDVTLDLNFLYLLRNRPKLSNVDGFGENCLFTVWLSDWPMAMECVQREYFIRRLQ